MCEVVVTGMGVVSALGFGVEATAAALLAGRSGIGVLRHLETAHRLPCGEVQASDDQLREMCGVANGQIVTRATLLGVLAAREAMAMAGVDRSGRVALISGTTVGGMESSERHYLDFLENDSQNAHIEVHDCGFSTSHIGELCGGNFAFATTISTACSSAANALILGANMLKMGLVDVVVAGGSECLTKFHLNGFNSLMILDTELCRPFCATRGGLNLGEGAAYVVLERAEGGRDAESLCRLSGYANACDAYHQTASSPDGRGAVLAMSGALQMAQLAPSQIDYINAHGTGTQNNDDSESAAILQTFANNSPLVSSTKAHTGHTTSAAGGVEAVISILALTRGFVPQSLNIRSNETGLNIVQRLITDTRLENVMSNSFGFGGNNSTLIFSRCI